jgi:rubredoxin-NAD+ reductase
MIIIIGTGLAGYQLAREFRKLDHTTPLMLVTADDGRYYPKPQLSTALTSKKTSETLVTECSHSSTQPGHIHRFSK